MGQGVAKTISLINKAKKEKSIVEEKIKNDEANLKAIEALEVKTDFIFPTVQPLFEKAKENIKIIAAIEEEAASLPAKAREVKTGLEDIISKEKEVEEQLREVFRKKDEGDLDSAIRLIKEAGNDFLATDFGIKLETAKTLDKIKALTLARLLSMRYEKRIEENLVPCEIDDAHEFLGLVSMLDEGFAKDGEIESLIDLGHGYLCLAYAAHEFEIEHNAESLLALAEVENQERAFAETSSKITKLREDVLYKTLADEYKELFRLYFFEEKDFDKVVGLFTVRTIIKQADYPAPAIRDSENVKELRRYFDVMLACSESDEDYEKRLADLATCPDTKDDRFELIAMIIACIDLSFYRFGLLINSSMSMSFELRVAILGRAMEIGIEDRRQVYAFDKLYASEDKNGDLEFMAPYLWFIKKHICDDANRYFKVVLSDVIRSPHARKVKTKSRVGALHALFGEDEENFKQPLGNNVKTTFVKSWDAVKLFIYGMLLGLLPTLLCIAAGALIYFLPKNQNLSSILQVVPLTVFMIFFSILGYNSHGRDERGSAVCRDIIGVTSLVCAIISLLYFIFPTDLSFFAKFGYGLFIYGIISMCFGYIFFKPHHKRMNFIVYLPALLCLIASIVFIILRLQSGLITIG